MLPTVNVPSYADVYSQLGTVYDPQIDTLLKQQSSADTNATAQLSSLDQAKVNAFRDITNSANSKGMLFSGFSPDQQATYLGTKYLPARANLENTLTDTKNTIAGKIAQLQGQRTLDAQKEVSTANTAAQDAAYKNAQLALSQARLNISAARASGGSGGSSGPGSSSGSGSFSGGSSRSSGGSITNSSGKTVTPTTQNVTAALRGQVSAQKLVGGDGHVAPSTLAAMYNTWSAYGLDDAAFWKAFQGLWNPSQASYKQQFNAAKNAG